MQGSKVVTAGRQIIISLNQSLLDLDQVKVSLVRLRTRIARQKPVFIGQREYRSQLKLACFDQKSRSMAVVEGRLIHHRKLMCFQTRFRLVVLACRNPVQTFIGLKRYRNHPILLMTCFGRSRHRNPRIEAEVPALLRSLNLLTIQIDFLRVLKSAWLIRSQSFILEHRRCLQFIMVVQKSYFTNQTFLLLQT